MRSILKLAVLLSAGLPVLSGCDQAPGSGVQVTGTVSGNYTSVQGNPTVTARNTSQFFSTTFVMSAMDSNNQSFQSGAFTISDVPEGTYSVSVNWYGYAGTATYSINGAPAVGTTAVQGALNGNYYGYTITVDGVPVSGDTTVDIYLGNTG